MTLPKVESGINQVAACDHRAMFADEDLHRQSVENLEQADALLVGRAD